MSSSTNRVCIIGRIGKTPELLTLNDNSTVCRFSVACTEKWTERTSGKKMEKCVWVQCVAWGALSRVATQFLAKGRLAMIDGKLDSRNFEDKKGITRYVTEVIVQNITFLDSKIPESESDPEPEKQTKFQYKKQQVTSKKKAA